MSATRFFAPDSLEDALRLLAEYRGGAVVVNGGTDIVEKIAFDRIRPEAVVYIGNIRSLRAVGRRAGYTIIGGGVVYADILRSPLCAPLAALRDAIAEIGSPPIRAVRHWPEISARRFRLPTATWRWWLLVPWSS